MRRSYCVLVLQLALRPRELLCDRARIGQVIVVAGDELAKVEALGGDLGNQKREERSHLVLH